MRFRRFPSITRATRAGLIASALIASACQTPVENPIYCTDIFLYGISATVTDAVTGANITPGSSLIAREGSYVDSVAAGPGSFLAAAGERPGTYEVTVRRAGYLPFSKTGVIVTADQCHVIPVTVAAPLQPAP